MKAHKEITIAVIIGLIFGLVVVGGVLRAREAIERSRTSRPSPTSIASATTKVDGDITSGLTLELSTPDNQVMETGNITISGKTNPKGYIVILGEKGEYITIPGATGIFSQEVSLVKGANTIVITVYLEDGTKVAKTLTAVYTTGV